MRASRSGPSALQGRRSAPRPSLTGGAGPFIVSTLVYVVRWLPEILHGASSIFLQADATGTPPLPQSRIRM